MYGGGCSWNIFLAFLRSNQGGLPRGGNVWPEFEELIKAGQTEKEKRAFKGAGYANYWA